MPKYQDLYHQMLSRIVNGDYRAGDRLPSSAELAEQAKVSYITAHKVYEMLCRNNLVEARRGQGFFVLSDATEPFKLSRELTVGRIGLLLGFGGDDIYGEFYQRLIAKLLRSGHAPTALGYSWMMENCSFEEAKHIFMTYAAAGIETLVVRGDAHFPYRALYEVREHFRKIIFVMFYSGEMEFEGCPRILFDMTMAGKLAAEYILHCGFRKPVYLTQEPAPEELRRKHGITRTLFDLQMLDGIEAACRENGIHFGDAGRVIARNIPYFEHEPEVRARIEEALDAGYNSFICMNDSRALLVYRIAAERNLKIGRDIGVVGNFNTPLGEALYPRLTSIDLNLRMLTENVMDAISGNSTRTVYIEPKLIRRR